MYTTARQFFSTLSEINPVRASRLVYLRYISISFHLGLRFPSGHFPSDLYTKPLYEILVFPILSDTPPNLILLVPCPSNIHTFQKNSSCNVERKIEIAGGLLQAKFELFQGRCELTVI